MASTAVIGTKYTYKFRVKISQSHSKISGIIKKNILEANAIRNGSKCKVNSGFDI
jgi:hypothetical protein